MFLIAIIFRMYIMLSRVFLLVTQIASLLANDNFTISKLISKLVFLLSKWVSETSPGAWSTPPGDIINEFFFFWGKQFHTL